MGQLPGGLKHNGQWRQEYRFNGVNGTLEMALTDAAQSAPSTPVAVTSALCQALAEVAGGPATPERVRQLCVADRQFLMRALASHMGESNTWLSACCANCGESFDFHLELGQLPIQPAGQSFPEVQLELQGQAWRFRLPTGADQEALAGQDDPITLLHRCLLAPEPGHIGRLKEGDLNAIDEAMDAVSPGVVTEVQAPCPHCQHDNRVELNPYSLLGQTQEELLAEVHQIALHYHWSEREILALPQARRAAYLRLIDRSRGMTQ